MLFYQERTLIGKKFAGLSKSKLNLATNQQLTSKLFHKFSDWNLGNTFTCIKNMPLHYSFFLSFLVNLRVLIRVNYTYIFTCIKSIDKGELYIYFYSLILGVCVLFYYHFVSFYICFYFVDDTWVKKSKRRRKKTKWVKNGENWDSCHGMVLTCRSMRWTPVKNQRARCRSMSQLCRGMPRRFKKQNFEDMPQHAQIMPRHGDVYQLCYFGQLG